MNLKFSADSDADSDSEPRRHGHSLAGWQPPAGHDSQALHATAVALPVALAVRRSAVRFNLNCVGSCKRVPADTSLYRSGSGPPSPTRSPVTYTAAVNRYHPALALGYHGRAVPVALSVRRQLESIDIQVQVPSLSVAKQAASTRSLPPALNAPSEGRPLAVVPVPPLLPARANRRQDSLLVRKAHPLRHPRVEARPAVGLRAPLVLLLPLPRGVSLVSST